MDFPDPITFEGSAHVMAPTGGGWPYLQAVYNSRRNEYLALWTQDPLPPAAEAGIYVQRLDAEGRPLAAATRLKTDPSRRFEHPRIAYDPNQNSYMVAWSDGLASKAYLWRFDELGVPIGEPQGLGADTWTPRVVYNSARQEYLVTWNESVSRADCPQPSSALRGQRLSADGTPVAASFVILAADSAHNGYNVVYNAQADQYLVAWSNLDHGLFVRRLTSEGDSIEQPIPIPVGPWPQSAQSPSLAYHSGLGEFLIAWGDGDRDSHDVFATRLGPDGQPLGGPIRVSLDAADERIGQILPVADGYVVTIVRTITTTYKNGESSFSTTTRGQRIVNQARLGPDVSLDLGALGVAVAAGPDMQSFLVVARDASMKAQVARIR